MTLKALSGQHLQVGVVPQKNPLEEIALKFLVSKWGDTWPQDIWELIP